MEKLKEKKTFSCQTCGRRRFLFQLATITSASLLPNELFASLPKSSHDTVMPDKTDAVKVRLIYAYHLSDIQVERTWPNVGHDFTSIKREILNTLNSKVRDVEFIPTSARTAEDAKKVLAEDNERGDIAGYIIVQMNNWVPASEIFIKHGKPVIYIPLPYCADGGWTLNTAKYLNNDHPYFEVMTSHDFNDVVEMANAFALLKNGTPTDFKKAAREWRINHTPKYCTAVAKKDRIKCLSPEKTIEKLKGMKILSVENNSPDYFQKIKNDFGIDVEVVSFTDVDAKADKVENAKAKKLADRWTKEAKTIEEVSYDTLFGCAKMYYGMKEILKEHGAQAITINCLGGCYTGKIKNYPCLGFMELQDEDLFGICENDLDSTITMMVFHALTNGRMGYVSDPALDITSRKIIYAHCVSTRKFFGKKSKQMPFEILTHSEDRQGASVRTITPEGYPVTTLKLNVAARCMAIHSAITTGNDRNDRACRTKIVAEVVGDYNKIYSTWARFAWHRVTFYGDFAKEAIAFAQKIGYEIVYEA